jgi:uncharacterized membrane protein YqiK
MATVVTLVLIVLAVLVVLAFRFYRRATQDVSLVRTGLGGAHVIMGGGGLVIPVLHSLTEVGMNTMRLEIRREHRDALITGDRMRADVVAEFYVRVRPEREAVHRAAQSLGSRTTRPEELKSLIEGRFVDALRSAAAERSIEELHAGRRAFAAAVGDLVAESLEANGLELESVSITQLDQTAIEHFDPSNAFDAEGLTRLTEQIETRKRTRNEIEQDTAISIQRKTLETEQRRLELDRESEYARLQQRHDIAARRAQQDAETAATEAAERLRAEQARLESERSVEEARVALDRAVETLRIEKASATTVAEIKSETDRVVADLERTRRLEELEEARAAMETARERAVTARETEIAERGKAVELIAAEREAEREARHRRITTEAERDLAETAAEAKRIAAAAEADARASEAKGTLAAAEAEAEGERLRNEARNALGEAHLAAETRRHMLTSLPAIIGASAEPLKSVDSVRIVKVDGLTRGAAGAPDGQAPEAPGGLARDVLQATLDYRAQAPLVDQLMREVGIGGLEGQGGEIGGVAGAKETNPRDDRE